MIRIASSLALLLAVAAVLALAPAPAHAATGAARDTLADGTLPGSWTLANGLRVTTRHVPGARAVAITVAYGLGTDDDPAGKDGFEQALCDLDFTAAAGDLPERSREDLDSQRPLGWSMTATRHSTLLTEVSSTSSFPGVLREVALRMQGVHVTPAALAASVKSARATMAQQVTGPVGGSLYFLAREAAHARSDDEVRHHAQGGDLASLTVAQAQEEIARRFVPANASLAIAGNLSGVDVRALTRNLFEKIPAGVRFTPHRDSLRAGGRVLTAPRPGYAGWVMGVIAPALSDSSHPSFYLSTLLLGSNFRQLWEGSSGVPPFFYTLLDEPDLVRIYPPAGQGGLDPEALHEIVGGALDQAYQQVFTEDAYAQVRSQSLWLLGGPMEPELRRQMMRDPAALQTLARSMAARELLGGEAFWSTYRRRFVEMPPGGLQSWALYYGDTRNQVRLVIAPGK